MKNLYHKVAVASVCTALGFALGASEEAKAVTLTLLPNITFGVQDFNAPYLGDTFNGSGDIYAPSGPVVKGTLGEIAWLAEFYTGSFVLDPNTVITSAIVQTGIYIGVSDLELSSGYSNPRHLGLFPYTNPGSLGIFGFVGNAAAELWDFEAGIFLTSVDISSSSSGDILNFDVTSFINQRGNGHTFSGFAIRALNFGATSVSSASSGIQPRLIVETADVAESVPEPTTILTAAIALGWGGWLKRNNSKQQNKTKSQR